MDSDDKSKKTLTYPLTEGVDDIEEVSFAINQLKRYGGKPYRIARDKRNKYVIYTEPPTNTEIVYDK